MSDVTEKKRPTLVEDRNGDKRHYQSDEADAIFEPLEQRLEQRFHQLADMATRAELAESERDALKARVEELTSKIDLLRKESGR